jgi:hypothetical protein
MEKVFWHSGVWKDTSGTKPLIDIFVLGMVEENKLSMLLGPIDSFFKFSTTYRSTHE